MISLLIPYCLFSSLSTTSPEASRRHRSFGVGAVSPGPTLDITTPSSQSTTITTTHISPSYTSRIKNHHNFTTPKRIGHLASPKNTHPLRHQKEKKPLIPHTKSHITPPLPTQKQKTTLVPPYVRQSNHTQRERFINPAKATKQASRHTTLHKSLSGLDNVSQRVPLSRMQQ
ncbi:hypothetical protein HDV57DRAFT_21945 [Trichoderma longibrachiatum]